jgi:hypothetical protein
VFLSEDPFQRYGQFGVEATNADPGNLLAGIAWHEPAWFDEEGWLSRTVGVRSQLTACGGSTSGRTSTDALGDDYRTRLLEGPLPIWAHLR